MSSSSTSSSGMELRKEYTEELKTIIPESQALAESDGLEAAITLLLVFEKKTRLANDFINLKECCLHIVRLCREKNDWAKLNSSLCVIYKRRSQSKVCIEAVVKECYDYLDVCPNEQIKYDLAHTLKDVCEGKIYVEAISARLHLILALILEKKDDISGACDMIQDVHVETYGSISKLEKAEYILQQMRLNLLRKDYIRTMIQSRKMNRKTIESDDSFDKVKISFYEMMAEYYTYEKNTWEISLCYYKIYDTNLTKLDNDNKMKILETSVIYLLLSKYNNHSSDMMYRIKKLKDIENNILCNDIINLFTTNEIIQNENEKKLQNIINNHLCFNINEYKYIDANIANEFKSNLNIRVLQHNIRTIAKYYNRIYTSKLGLMLGLNMEDLEKHLSDMASNGDVYLKIDRPSGIVSFQSPTLPETVLSDWSSDMDKLLGIMENTCHLINREQMVHKA
jgi:26S proteasome regulatory subunit N5